MTDRVLYLNRNQSSPMYSNLKRMIADGKQGKAAPTQWISMIRAMTSKGVKSMEIEESGIIDWLEVQKDASITRDVLAAKIDSLMFTIKEVSLSKPKFTSYRQPGGKYHEYLYIANSERDNVIDDLERVEYEMQELVFTPEKFIDEPEVAINLERERERLMALKVKAIDFPNHHFSDVVNGKHGKNLLAHCRITHRPEDGLYFIEEIQSDWAQRGRKSNWTEIPKGPLVTNTEAWAGMVLRRHLQLAAMDPAIKNIAWITETMRNGGTQSKEAEAMKVTRKKEFDEAKAAVVAQKMALLPNNGEGMTKEALAEFKAMANLAATTEVNNQGIYEPYDMLNDFYLKVVPKIVDKILSGTGTKVQMKVLNIGDRQAEVPWIDVNDAVRQKLTEKQPVFSRGLLLNTPREINDPIIGPLLAEAARMLGSAKGVRFVGQLYDIATGTKVAGRFVNNFIQVSLSAANIEEALDHECFHYAQENLLSQHELDVMQNSFANGTTLNHKVREILTARGDYALAKECLNADEAAAQGFALWRQGALEVQEPPVTGIFSDLIQVVRDIGAWIKREALEQKFQTPEEIFSAFASGEIAKRQNDFVASQARFRMMA